MTRICDGGQKHSPPPEAEPEAEIEKANDESQRRATSKFDQSFALF